MSVQQAFTCSFELYKLGVKYKIQRINGKWSVVL